MSSLTSTAEGQQLVNDIQYGLGSLGDVPASHIQSLPASVRRRINGLKFLHQEHVRIEAKFHEEYLQLEKKYLELYRPLYEKRTKLVCGEAEPTEEEVAAGQSDNEEETPVKDSDRNDSDIKGIPEFWLTALKNHPQLNELITEEDEPALRSLIDIQHEYLEDNPGFKLVFKFAPNEYFKNAELVKTYYYQKSHDFGELVFDYAEGTEVEWNPGKNLALKVKAKKQRHKETKKTRVVKREVPCDTFFSFFTPVQRPSTKDVTNGASAAASDMDEGEEEYINDLVEADYELGEELKEKIIPHAVEWFTGKALQYEDIDIDDYDEEDYLDESSSNRDDEEEDEGDDKEVTEGTKGYGATGNPQDEQPSCKQQ